MFPKMMKSPRAYQWLLFDADGTLFDYDQAEASALKGAFQDFSLPFAPASAAAYQSINHQIWLEFENGQISAEALRVARFERLFEALQIQAEAKAFSAQYLRRLAQATELIEGAENTLRLLHGPYHLGLITNGLKDVQRSRLAGSVIQPYFETVAISEELGAAKPDPRFFDCVFAHIGHPPKDTVLVIGDSLSSDIQGGINYDLDTCWFNPKGKLAQAGITPTYEIQRISQLLELLGQAASDQG